eukprot:GDKI01027474.1.p1 GENE.GDKI01027474.1~~GDKI01027474.1.p1  ORF type:complete len:301 (-),score=60.63 GDKI01027474.1:154-1056(-)
MRVLQLLLCVYAWGVWEAKAVTQSSRVVFYTNTDTTSPRMPDVRIEYQSDIRELNIGLNFGAAIGTLTNEDEMQYDDILESFPAYNPLDPLYKKTLKDAIMNAVTNFTRYEIVVKDPKMGHKSYTERVYKGAIANGYIEGGEARTYLIEKVLSKPEIRPVLFLFETVQRLASPGYMLSGILKQAFGPDHPPYDRYEDETDWQKRVAVKYYYNLNDNENQYTPHQLAKLFTPLPTHPDDNKYTHLKHAHTPIQGIAIKLLELKEKYLDYQVAHMRFYSSKIDPKTHDASPPPASDLIISYN